jgi:hypothetical protein
MGMIGYMCEMAKNLSRRARKLRRRLSKHPIRILPNCIADIIAGYASDFYSTFEKPIVQHEVTYGDTVSYRVHPYGDFMNEQFVTVKLPPIKFVPNLPPAGYEKTGLAELDMWRPSLAAIRDIYGKIE